ncbi:tetratricopeptide repeat protein 12 [Spea bombifrons]|uniref:tetratricopeptide repeat protein 12 n=1 Tax=Spea bombifrons TaxID=233779 RepID=UPI00234AC57E|nr:tetratricopeptide repeat protein 12 [Spea bombifrons]
MSVDRSLEDFLKDVDEITEIVQSLNSEDTACREKAFLKADKKIALLKDNEDMDGTKTKLNRTVINSSPNNDFSQPNSGICQESFLEVLEKDAKERAEKRKENTALANALKGLGNEAFAQGDYETAVTRYTEGLDKLKDMQVLYTNRAQAYIKLKKYKEGIRDCEWALKCNDKCTKAYIHMGRAYLGLKEYEEARKSYLKAMQIDCSLENLVKGYLNQADSQERKDSQEQNALEEFKAGKENALTVTHLLQKLSKEDQIPLYYSGGIKLLVEVVKDCTGQTLFRTNNGFRIIGDNKVINRSLVTAPTDHLHLDLCMSVLALWQTVCRRNEENQYLLVTHKDMSTHIHALLSSEVPDVQRETLSLMNICSSTEGGKALLLKNVDPPRLLQSLLEFALLMDGRASDAMNLLHAITLQKSSKIHFRTNFSSASLPRITALLRKVNLANKAVFPQCISMLGNLIEDEDIRRQMAASLDSWDSCLLILDECIMHGDEAEYRDILSAVLGLMLNLSLELNSATQDRGMDISCRCLTLLNSDDGIVLTRCVGILSRVLPQCTAAVEEVVRKGLVKKLVKLLKAGGPRTSLYAVKALAVCTKQNVQARNDVIKCDKKFHTLLNLLSSTDEIIVGNAALCLGYCFEVPGAASSLLQSDVLKRLLTHAGGDTKRTAVQQNAAIALGRLCTAEPRYMSQLRELHGIEILNSCMKYIN